MNIHTYGPVADKTTSREASIDKEKAEVLASKAEEPPFFSG
jgi:hypothetical protein